MEKIFLGYWNVSVILTYAELLCAVEGIFLSAEGRPMAAILCLMICGVCDMFDGKIARATKRSADACLFGIQIDSLCDLVSFGVLPSAIGYAFGVTGWGKAILALYTLMALVRLGYFNVSEQKRQQETTENRHVYEGLPVTTSALILPLLTLLRKWLTAKFAKLYTLVLGIMAVLFISRIRVKKPQI